MRVSASGGQVVIQHGEHRATVVEVGGGLRSYTVGGEDIIDGYDEAEMCPSGRGQALLPWPNRIADGRYEFGGNQEQLPLTEPSRANAIHGLTRFASWAVKEAGVDGVTMTHRLYPQPGYPYLLDLGIDYRLDGSGLTVTMTAVNVGDAPCPFGAGAHPYLRVGSGGIDDLVLRCPAATWFEADERGIPRARRDVEGTAVDFRSPRAIGATLFDTAFTDLARGDDGRALVVLAAPDGSRRVVVWCGPEFTDLMLYSGDTLGQVDRRRRSLAIEPMTCPPNAFQSGEGVITLTPGAAFRGSWGIAPQETGVSSRWG